MESKLIGVHRVGAFGDDDLIFESNQKIPNCHIHHLGPIPVVWFLVPRETILIVGCLLPM
jgi:hypothetical protein